MICNYRYCNKEINYGRPDRKFCNKNCRIKENNIVRELKSLNMKSKKGKEFILRAQIKHNNKYKYDLVVYENSKTKVKIICPYHGIFNQSPGAHLYSGYGCEKCSRDSHKLTSLSSERLSNIMNIHKNMYEYRDLSITEGFINIYCPTHGTFSQYIYYHEYGHGCSLCNSTSKGENKIKSHLGEKNIDFYMNYSFDDCRNKRKLKFDFYLPNYKVVIEYDGPHHFKENKYFGIGNLEYISNNDNIKNKYCFDNNIKIIRISYWDYNKIDDILNTIL
jgi:hypothetical protein